MSRGTSPHLVSLRLVDDAVCRATALSSELCSLNNSGNISGAMFLIPRLAMVWNEAATLAVQIQDIPVEAVMNGLLDACARLQESPLRQSFLRALWDESDILPLAVHHIQCLLACAGYAFLLVGKELAENVARMAPAQLPAECNLLWDRITSTVMLVACQPVAGATPLHAGDADGAKDNKVPAVVPPSEVAALALRAAVAAGRRMADAASMEEFEGGLALWQESMALMNCLCGITQLLVDEQSLLAFKAGVNGRAWLPALERCIRQLNRVWLEKDRPGLGQQCPGSGARELLLQVAWVLVVVQVHGRAAVNSREVQSLVVSLRKLLVTCTGALITVSKPDHGGAAPPPEPSALWNYVCSSLSLCLLCSSLAVTLGRLCAAQCQLLPAISRAMCAVAVALQQGPAAVSMSPSEVAVARTYMVYVVGAWCQVLQQAAASPRNVRRARGDFRGEEYCWDAADSWSMLLHDESLPLLQALPHSLHWLHPMSAASPPGQQQEQTAFEICSKIGTLLEMLLKEVKAREYGPVRRRMLVEGLVGRRSVMPWEQRRALRAVPGSGMVPGGDGASPGQGSLSTSSVHAPGHAHAAALTMHAGRSACAAQGSCSAQGSDAASAPSAGDAAAATPSRSAIEGSRASWYADPSADDDSRPGAGQGVIGCMYLLLDGLLDVHPSLSSSSSGSSGGGGSGSDLLLQTMLSTAFGILEAVAMPPQEFVEWRALRDLLGHRSHLSHSRPKAQTDRHTVLRRQISLLSKAAAQALDVLDHMCLTRENLWHISVGWDRVLQGVSAAARCGSLVGCWNPLCTETRGSPLEWGAARWTCAGCGVARYCSAQCQRAAWLAMHRHTCACMRADRGDAAP